MGKWKDEAMENEQGKHSERLAEELGITLDELQELEYNIETDGNKDGMIYGYRVEFDVENCPPGILQRIPSLEDGCRVNLDINWGERPEDED